MHISALTIYTIAIVVDSAVTLAVGFWLNRTAKTEVKQAVKEIEPAIRLSVSNIADEFKTETKQEIGHSIQKLIPLIIKGMKNAGRANASDNDTSKPGSKPYIDKRSNIS